MPTLRMLGRDLHSSYGPTADTESLVKGETAGGCKTALPGPGERPVTERPSSDAGI